MSFVRGAARLECRPRAARPRVAYFVDVFANYNDPSIAEAVTAVLHYNGVEVYVPPGQIGCGMAPLSYGDVETARKAVQQTCTCWPIWPVKGGLFSAPNQPPPLCCATRRSTCWMIPMRGWWRRRSSNAPRSSVICIRRDASRPTSPA